MVSLTDRARGRRSTKSNSPSGGANEAQSPAGGGGSSSLNNFPFTFEYSIHSATTSIQIEADVRVAPAGIAAGPFQDRRCLL